jgi:hypothetical protein
MASTEPGDREGPPGSLTGPLRDIVVIGASRGGIEALRGIVSALPSNLQPRSSSWFTSALRMRAYYLTSFPEPAHFRPSTEEMARALSAAAFTWRLRTIT